MKRAWGQRSGGAALAQMVGGRGPQERSVLNVREHPRVEAQRPRWAEAGAAWEGGGMARYWMQDEILNRVQDDNGGGWRPEGAG